MQEVITQSFVHSGSASWIGVQQMPQQPGHYFVLLLIRDQFGQVMKTTAWHGTRHGETGIKVPSLQATAVMVYCNELLQSCCCMQQQSTLFVNRHKYNLCAGCTA